MQTPFRFAILDDYQNVALSMANWAAIPGLEAVPFHSHIADESTLVTALQDFDGVLLMRERTPFPASLMQKLPSLRLIVTTGSKNASIDMKAAHDLKITVCGTRASSVPPAELTWGLILALLRDIPGQAASAQRGEWQTRVGMNAAGRTLGLLGLGRIGQMIARYGQAFGMNVIAWSPNLTQERADKVSVTAVSKTDLFAKSDIISLHIRASDTTYGIVGAREIRAMKSSALLVNTSRAELVDDGALVAALREGRIAGAATDVFRSEPAAVDHPLFSLPNVIATPHIGYVTQENYDVFYRDAAECVERFLAGDPIRLVD